MSFCHLESSGNGLFVLTMASTDGHNYLTEEAITELLEVLEKVQSMPEAKGLVTTCECEARSFCAGLDYDLYSEEQAEEVGRRVGEVIRLLLELPVPTVAAVRGHATSLGLALALAHDQCVVLDDAVLGLPEARRGRRLPDYVPTLLREKLSSPRLRKLLMLKSQPCTGQELVSKWRSTYGASGDREVVLDKAIFLLSEIQVGDGTNLAKTRHMLCAETSAAVGITTTTEKHKPRSTPDELSTSRSRSRSSDHEAAEPSVIREKPTTKRYNSGHFGNMFKNA